MMSFSVLVCSWGSSCLHIFITSTIKLCEILHFQILIEFTKLGKINLLSLMVWKTRELRVWPVEHCSFVLINLELMLQHLNRALVYDSHLCNILSLKECRLLRWHKSLTNILCSISFLWFFHCFWCCCGFSYWVSSFRDGRVITEVVFNILLATIAERSLSWWWCYRSASVIVCLSWCSLAQRILHKVNQSSKLNSMSFNDIFNLIVGVKNNVISLSLPYN